MEWCWTSLFTSLDLSFHIENMRAIISSHWAAVRAIRDICGLRSVNTSPDVRMLSSTACQREKDRYEGEAFSQSQQEGKTSRGEGDHRGFSEAQWEPDHPQICNKVKGHWAQVILSSVLFSPPPPMDRIGPPMKRCLCSGWRVNDIFVQPWLERGREQQGGTTPSSVLESLRLPSFFLVLDNPSASWQLRVWHFGSSFYFFIFIFLIHLFIYFWLCWVFVVAHGLSLVAASEGYSS